MKMQLKFLAVALFTIMSAACYAQAGVYMFSTAIPGTLTGGVHNGETPITSYSRNYTNLSSVPGPPTNNGFTILKPNGSNSIIFKDRLWRGQALGARLEFRFYNNADVMYYKITLGTGVLVADITESGEVCATGCPGISEQIKFEFVAIEERDLIANIFRCWNFASNSPACPN